MAGSVSQVYDSNRWITSRSVNAANTITFGYDNDGLMTSAGTLSLSYNATNGFLVGTTLGSVNDTFAYNAFW